MVSQYSQIVSQIDCLIISVICSYLDTTLRNKICFNVNASADIPTSQLHTTARVRIPQLESVPQEMDYLLYLSSSLLANLVCVLERLEKVGVLNKLLPQGQSLHHLPVIGVGSGQSGFYRQ